MKILTRNETAEFLSAHDQYVILTHNHPDGDTIGSAAALCRGLRALGKTAHVLENPGVTPFFRWLHEGLTVTEAADTDTVISVDVAAPNMLPPEFESLLGRIRLRIDHHGAATSFTDCELVDAASASCAELVYDVLNLLGVSLDAAIAEAIYVGTATDTGCFRYANTTAHTFTTAAACAQAGAPVFQLNLELFETNSLAKLRMQGWIVDHLNLFRDGAMCVCAIPKSVETELGADSEDMNNISSFPRTIAGVRMAATLREGKEDTVRVSIRAVPGLDAAHVAGRFGGGGHKGAAGATIRGMTLAEAAAAIQQAMEEEMP